MASVFKRYKPSILFFFFFCKLFDSKCTGQLCNEGTRDWKNISSKIRNHETTREYITNMNTWLDLKMRLSKK